MATNKTVQVLLPEYMEKFSCIGSACEDTCCAGWSVPIDKSTYKLYRNNKDKELKKLFDEHISRNKKNPSDNYYAKFNMLSDNSCPFLNEQKLCSIQLKLGENHLSQTCQTYPRVLHSLNDTIEKSATLSCPEAARLALLNPEKMKFIQKDDTVDSKHLSGVFLTNDPSFLNGIGNYLWDLRVFTIQLLQSREYALWERLVLLGMFFQTVQDYSEQGRLQELPDLISEYIHCIENGAFDKVLSEIPTNELVQFNVLTELLKFKRKAGTHGRRFMEFFLAFHQGIIPEDDVSNETILKQYHLAYEQYYAPFMKEHDYMLEHYLVNYIFKNLFPYGRSENVYENYVFLVTHYSLIKMLLIGLAGFYKERFSVDHVVGMTSAFAKEIEHNTTLLREIGEYMKNNDYQSLSHMMLLIKH